MNNFEEDLAYSYSDACNEFWQTAYSRAFPAAMYAVVCTEPQQQKWGVDRVLRLRNDTYLRFDEKTRRKKYDDFVLEYISVDTTRSPGWIEKHLFIDYIAYGFVPACQAYFIPWPELQKVWWAHKRDWISRAKDKAQRAYRLVEADNGDYKTLTVAVPINVVVREVAGTFRVMWSPD